MFQKIHDKINSGYITEVRKTKEDILNLVREKSKRNGWWSNLLGNIAFNEFKVTDDCIEIIRMPDTFTPFRAFGKNRLNLLSTDDANVTKIKCDILPGNNTIPYVVICSAIILLVWISLFLLFARDLNWISKTVVVVGVPLFVMGLIYFSYRRAKISLTGYSRKVIKWIDA